MEKVSSSRDGRKSLIVVIISCIVVLAVGGCSSVRSDVAKSSAGTSQGRRDMSEYRKFMQVSRLPKMPESITPLAEGEKVMAIVMGGLSIIGEDGYMCPIVTLMTGDGDNAWGWSLSLGVPGQKEELYFFDTGRKTHRGTELPNTMVYFQAKVDAKLLAEETDLEEIKRIVAYVLPHISDDGPPPSE